MNATTTSCAHCGMEVEDRGHPVARDGEGICWYSNWVHADGGHRTCYPQQGDNSPKAEPAATAGEDPCTCPADWWVEGEAVHLQACPQHQCDLCRADPACCASPAIVGW